MAEVKKTVVRKKEGMVSKAMHKIDDMIHPDHKMDESVARSAEELEEMSAKAEQDYSQHPKFAKFNKGNS